MAEVTDPRLLSRLNGQPAGLRPLGPPPPGVQLDQQYKTGQIAAQGRDANKDAVDLNEQGLRIKKLETDLAKPENQATEGERKASAFVQRAIGGFRDYDSLGMGPRSVVGQAVHDIAPGVLNALPDDVGNSPDRVAADRAQREFVSAILRYDSGATIPPEEIASQSQIYFPKAGQTSDEELSGYRQARIRGIESLVSSAGRAVTPEIQRQIDEWRKGLGQPEVLNPGEADPQIATGDLKTEPFPERAGLNGFVKSAIRGGATNREILAALKQRGVDNAALVEIAPQLIKLSKFIKDNPGFKGDFTVDLERRMVPTTLGNRIAASGPGAMGIALGDTYSGGHLDNLIGATGGDSEDANAKMQAARAGNPGYSLAGDALGGASLYLTGAGALGAAGAAPQAGRVAALAPRALAGDAALGGYVASGQGGTQIADPMQVLTGAGLGAGTGFVTRGTLNSAGALASPTGGDLAPLYEAGVRPTIGQRMGAGNWAGRSVNRAEQAFASVPIIGGIQRSARNSAVEDMQRGAFNDALGEINLKLPKGVKKGTQAHKFMQTRFDAAYDKARSGMQFAPDGQWTSDMSAMLGDVNLLSGDSRNTFKQFASLVGGKLSASGGTLGGEQYKLVMSRIGKKVGSLRSNPSGDSELADALESLGQAIDDAARRQSAPDSVKLLDSADRGYAKAVVIENAARLRGGSAGEFNGTQLDASVQRTNKSRRSRAYLRGEATMQDYASAAKKLGDEVPDSGTTERMLAVGGLGALAKFVNPFLLTPYVADTAANLPGVRQAVGAALAPRPQAIRPATDKARGILELLGRYGAPATSVPVVTD